jgi:hypothetical protein
MAESFVVRDRELESVQQRSIEKLAQHRWHWTLDDSNPDRVSIAEYARRVSRGRATIHRMAYGYKAWSVRNSGHSPGEPVTLTDFIEQANLAAEKAEAVEAVAAATGKSFSNTAVSKRAEVRDVLDTARERAERKGTTVSDELPAVADFREKARRAAQKEKDSRRASHFMLVEVEGHIGAAMRRLRQALAIARDVDFDAEETELLEDSIAKLRMIVDLIDVRITGERGGIDWDTEFTKVMEG